MDRRDTFIDNKILKKKNKAMIDGEDKKYNVNSYNQYGGITAGEINITLPQHQQRKLDKNTKQRIIDFVKEAQEKNKKLEIAYYGSARETYNFFNEVTKFLNDNKINQYNSSHIPMTFGFPIPQGLNFSENKDQYIIEIGEL